jgi:endoglucanase
MLLPQLYAFPSGLFTTPIASASTQFFLKGINWFGFETETFSPHGMWSTSMDYLLDFLQMEKFNALRVPFSTEFAENMDKITPSGIDYVKNPELQGKTAGQVMDILVKKCRERGIYIMPDMHRFKGASGIPQLWYNEEYSEQRVIEAWKKLVHRYKHDTTVFAADLKNEPHGIASWGSGDPKTDWAAAAERIGNALLDVNPKLLIFVEGVDRTKDPNRTSWWGGSLDQVERRPIKLKIPNRLVYSPHVYGPDVFSKSYFSKEAGFPSNLPAIWNSDFGFIRKKNLAPIIIGEWGGQNAPGSKDREWQEAITKYFVQNGFSCATFYWSLNPNSGDTKGVIDDDWVTGVKHRLEMNRRVCPKPTMLVPPSAKVSTRVSSAFADSALDALRAIAIPYFHRVGA